MTLNAMQAMINEAVERVRHIPVRAAGVDEIQENPWPWLAEDHKSYGNYTEIHPETWWK